MKIKTNKKTIQLVMHPGQWLRLAASNVNFSIKCLTEEEYRKADGDGCVNIDDQGNVSNADSFLGHILCECCNENEGSACPLCGKIVCQRCGEGEGPSCCNG